MRILITVAFFLIKIFIFLIFILLIYISCFYIDSEREREEKIDLRNIDIFSNICFKAKKLYQYVWAFLKYLES
jgi:hypothetical protein